MLCKCRTLNLCDFNIHTFAKKKILLLNCLEPTACFAPLYHQHCRGRALSWKGSEVYWDFILVCFEDLGWLQYKFWSIGICKALWEIACKKGHKNNILYSFIFNLSHKSHKSYLHLKRCSISQCWFRFDLLNWNDHIFLFYSYFQILLESSRYFIISMFQLQYTLFLVRDMCLLNLSFLSLYMIYTVLWRVGAGALHNCASAYNMFDHVHRLRPQMICAHCSVNQSQLLSFFYSQATKEDQ